MEPTGTRIKIETTLKTTSGGMTLAKPVLTNKAVVVDAGKSKELEVGMQVIFSQHSGLVVSDINNVRTLIIEENDIWGKHSKDLKELLTK